MPSLVPPLASMAYSDIVVAAVHPVDDGLFSTLDLYRLTTDGSDPVNLTNTSDTAEDNPAWSPTGTQIAYRASQGSGNEIRILDVESGESMSVTQDLLIGDRLSWSPDGSQIAFTAKESSERTDLYILRLTDHHLERLTETGGRNASPSWSPDGQFIVFESNRNGNFELYVMTLEDKSLVRVTHNEQVDYDPVWSPNGEWIAYTCSSPRTDGICLIHPDGSGVQRLMDADKPEDGQEATWSPDGRLIAFRSIRDGLDSIYVMNLDGKAVIRVSFEPWVCQKPDWRKPKD